MSIWLNIFYVSFLSLLTIFLHLTEKYPKTFCNFCVLLIPNLFAMEIFHYSMICEYFIKSAMNLFCDCICCIFVHIYTHSWLNHYFVMYDISCFLVSKYLISYFKFYDLITFFPKSRQLILRKTRRVFSKSNVINSITNYVLYLYICVTEHWIIQQLIH